MRHASFPSTALALISFAGLCAPLRAQVNVTTYHNDISRSGANTAETVLTPANVNSATFGKWFSEAVDGQVYAQPLVLANVGIGGGTHNVVYVATEHDSVYAIDAKTGVIYWHVSLIPAGGTTVSAGSNNGSAVNCFLLTPEIGITGTPVIDPGSGTLYVVAQSLVGGVQRHALHALSVSTGAEKFGGPVTITASAPGTASDGNGSTVSFNPAQHLQRAALLLEQGHVIIGWGSNCDQLPWHGWVMSYGAASLAQEAVFNPSADGFGNAVWLSGGGMAADTAGNTYFATGNGSWNGTTDFGDSVVKLAAPTGGSFPLADYFTPYDQLVLAEDDNDVGSSSLVLLPPLASGEQLIAQSSKLGTMFLLNAGDLGHYCVDATPVCTSGDPQIVQEIPNASQGTYGAPAYWNGSIFWGAASQNGPTDHIKAFSFNANGSGLLSTAPTSQTAQSFGYPPPVPSISANGTTSAILWGTDNSQYGNFCSGGSGCQVLYAYDATNLANQFYNSNQAANGRDVPGGAVKYTTPTIANGEVIVGGADAVSVYGLLASAPVFNSVPVNLGPSANVSAISSLGGSPGNGGFDNDGYAFAASLLPATFYWNGATFNLGGAAAPSGVTSTTVPLPSGSYGALDLIAAGANGPQTNQTFVATYTDGTTSTFTQSISDWASPQNFPGEAVASETGYRIIPSGMPSQGTWFMFGYSFHLNSAKTVKSLTLPANRNVVLMAASLVPVAGAGTTTAGSTPSFTLTPAQATLTLQQNQGGTDSVTVTPVNGFSGNVTLAVAGLPAGASSIFVGNLLVVFPASTTAVGNYPLTITGTSGSATATTKVNLAITSAATFSLSASPTALALGRGTSGTVAIKLAPLNGFTGSVAFGAAGLPGGATVQFSPSSSASGTTLTITAAPNTAVGSYPLTITGTAQGTGNSNGFTISTSVTLSVK